MRVDRLTALNRYVIRDHSRRPRWIEDEAYENVREAGGGIRLIGSGCIDVHPDPIDLS
jgi:hypothetical protein